MCPPLYRRHDLKMGFITEHGIPGLGELKEKPIAKSGVGLSHSSDNSSRKRKGAKGLGYLVMFRINNHEKAWEDFYGITNRKNNTY